MTNNSIAWESTNPSSNQYISVSFANGGGVSFIGGNHSVQPSISGNGRYVVYIEKTSSAQAVKIYDTQASTFTQAFSNGSAFIKPSFFDPSTCNDASKVVYLSRMVKGIGNVSYSIKLYTKATNTTTTIVSGAQFSHPHLSADCNYLTYAQKVNDAYRIKTRSLITNLEVDSTTPAAPRNHYAPFWQK
jgi:hypothetical protein